MASVRKIAADAGVSVGTVSRVLNNHPHVSSEARQKVLDAISERGYINPVISRQSLRTVALLSAGGPLALEGPYDLALLRGVYLGMVQHAYNLLLLDAERNQKAGESATQTLLRLGVSGVLLRTSSQSTDVVREIAEGPVPAVLVADHLPDLPIASVRSDSSAAIRQAVGQLVQLGHRRIAITLNVVVDHDHQRRHEQWAAALREAGIRPSDDLVMTVPANADAGAATLRQLRAMADRPTAIFATDPLAAAGILQEALRLGVDIPGDLSVLGFDDTETRQTLHPRMSAICQDTVALGSRAFERLERLMRDGGKSKPSDDVMECWYDPQNSVGPPPRRQG